MYQNETRIDALPLAEAEQIFRSDRHWSMAVVSDGKETTAVFRTRSGAARQILMPVVEGHVLFLASRHKHVWPALPIPENAAWCAPASRTVWCGGLQRYLRAFKRQLAGVTIVWTTDVDQGLILPQAEALAVSNELSAMGYTRLATSEVEAGWSSLFAPSDEMAA